jgi:hypothetical protein
MEQVSQNAHRLALIDVATSKVQRLEQLVAGLPALLDRILACSSPLHLAQV